MDSSFTNDILIKISVTKVKEVLENLENLKKWDSEIALVENKTNDTTHLVRHGPAINSSEYIKVEKKEDCVIYYSFGGTVEYTIVFKLQQGDDGTKLQQNVTITHISENISKVDKLIVIAKEAFYEKLKALRDICEQKYEDDAHASQEDFNKFTENREELQKVDKFFFENSIDINADRLTLVNLLINIDRIIEWDHDISDVQKDETGFRIIRATPAINEFEHIEIKQQGDDVIYVSTEGLVEYRVIFNIQKLENGKLHLTENVTLTGYPSFPIPFAVFQPITQNAFYQVLEVLKSVAEVEELKTK